MKTLRNTQDLRDYLFASIEGLDQASIVEAAFLLRNWAASTSNMVSAGTALPVKAGNIIGLINDLLAFRGGVACGGAAEVFIGALRAYGIPAAEYYYGFNLPGQRFSHLTTVLALHGKPYTMDAYLCYHFEDREGALLPLTQMLRMVKQEKYNQIVRVDGIATRARVCKIGAKIYGRFAGGIVPPGKRHGNLMVYHGCQMSVTGFLLSGARVKMFKDVYGDRPIDEILLDCMFANARIGPGLGPPLRQKLTDILAGGNRNA